MIKIGKSATNISVYSCQPKTREELKDIIDERIKSEGNNCDLNDIDVSLIDDMSWMFANSKFRGDISRWNTSNVENMEGMFRDSDFNGDISKWDVSKVKCMESMFVESAFGQDIRNWNISNVENMIRMFAWSKFNQDISKWKINKDCYVDYIFHACPIREEFKPKLLQKK